MTLSPEELKRPKIDEVITGMYSFVWEAYRINLLDDLAIKRRQLIKESENKSGQNSLGQKESKDKIRLIQKLSESDPIFNYKKGRKESDTWINPFVYYNGQIYMLNTTLLGRGAYGKVKLGSTETGAIKVFKTIKSSFRKNISESALDEEVKTDELKIEQFVRNLNRISLKTGSVFSVVRSTKKYIDRSINGNLNEKRFLSSLPSPLEKSYTSVVYGHHKVIFISDYAGEENLREYATKRNFSLLIAKLIVLHACLEVEKVQRINEVHRDIKAGNFRITFSEDNLDFFLLRLIDFDFSEELRRQEGFVKNIKEVLGTPGYIPPEAKQENNICLNRKTDVFSLGAMCERDFDMSSEVVEAMLEADPDKRISLLEATNYFWKGAAEEYRNQGIDIDAKKHLKEAFASILRMNLIEAVVETVKKIQDTIYFLYKPENDLAFIELQNLAKVYSNTFTLGGYEEEKNENSDECERIIFLMKRFLQACLEERAKNPIGSFSPVVNELFSRIGNKSLQETLGIDLGDPNHPFSCLKNYVDIFSNTHEEALEFERVFRSTHREKVEKVYKDSDSSGAASSKASSSEGVSVESVELETTRTTERLSM